MHLFSTLANKSNMRIQHYRRKQQDLQEYEHTT